MRPSLISKKDCQQKKIRAWINGIDKTGYMRTSAIPSSDAISNYSAEGHIVIEAIDFNQHVCPLHFRKVIDSALFTLSDTIDVLDFGSQRVDSRLLDVMLAWLDTHKVVIKQLNLSNLSLCHTAWKQLFTWMRTSACQINSIDLGKVKMCVDKARDLASVLTEIDGSVCRLDFGYSVWAFQAMKAFLWSGGVSGTSSLSRLALGDAHFCNNSLRLLISYVFPKSNGVQVFSSGVVDLPDRDLLALLASVQSPESSIQSLVLSHQSFSKESTQALGSLMQRATSVSHLALINCWLDMGSLAESFSRGVIDHLHIEAITAGQIQQYVDLFQAKGYRVAREVSRHRIRMQRDV